MPFWRHMIRLAKQRGEVWRHKLVCFTFAAARHHFHQSSETQKEYSLTPTHTHSATQMSSEQDAVQDGLKSFSLVRTHHWRVFALNTTCLMKLVSEIHTQLLSLLPVYLLGCVSSKSLPALTVMQVGIPMRLCICSYISKSLPRNQICMLTNR